MTQTTLLRLALITGDDGPNTLYGTGEDDTLIAGGGNDKLLGGVGDDFLDAGDGDDRVFGNLGDDTILGSAGSDRITGNDGFDTLDYATSPSGITISAGVLGIGGYAQGDQIDAIEVLIGSAFADHLIGAPGVVQIHANAGNDVLSGTGLLDGGTGLADRVSYYGSTQDLLLILDGNVSVSGTFRDQLRGIEWATGGAGDDTMRGNDADNLLDGQTGDDILTGNGGNDTLRGGAGNDVFVWGAGADVFDGGMGADRVSYASSMTALTIHLDNAFAATGAAIGDRFIGVENATGTQSNDAITGSASSNTLSGYFGDDTLNGGQGNDALIGGSGIDTFLFSPNFGDDRIIDFEIGIERVDLSAVPGASAASLTFGIGINGFVVADVADEGSICFIGITDIAAITAADFVF